jgi:hypothetical protein
MRNTIRFTGIVCVCLAAGTFSTATYSQDKQGKARSPEKQDTGEHLRIIGRSVLVTKSGAELRTRKGVVWRS